MLKIHKTKAEMICYVKNDFFAFMAKYFCQRGK
jgi:hypothetical protein